MPDDLILLPGVPRNRVVPRDVRLAIAFMRRSMGQHLTATDLAHLCGVPERTLHRHFLAFTGHAPLVHFRLMRLAAVREALLAPGDQAASVTEIATRHGFAHLGRFSSEYRHRFGEPPSATLVRGRATAAETASAPDAGRADVSPADWCGDAAGWQPAPAARRQVPTLAVLPFQTGVGALEERLFAEALAERFAAALSQAHGFSIRLARAAPGEPAHRSRALGARYCLTGRVMRCPEGRVQVVARLLDAAAGDLHLWGDAFGGAMSDLPELQERVVEAVVRAIRPSVEAAEIDCARRKPACSLGSRDLVLRALPLALAADPASAQRALGLLEDAIVLDPDDPAPVALAGWCRMQLVMYGAAPNLMAEVARAQDLANRAAALDPLGDPLVLTARSGIAMATRRREEADALLARAHAIDPGFGWAWERSGWVRVNHGEAEAGLARFRRAVPLKGPRAPMSNCLAGIGCAHFSAGRFGEAARWIRRAMAENPGAVWLNRELAPCYVALGEHQAARESLDRLRRAYPLMTVSCISARRAGTVGAGVQEAEGRILEGLAALGLPL